MGAVTKVIAWVLGIFLVILVIGFFVRMIIHAPNDDEIVEAGTPGESAEYLRQAFRERLVERATSRLGQPIEGFDANLLLMAVPGLMPQDFNGVASSEGVYAFRDEALRFSRTTEAFTSTAERTLRQEGYDVLFENVKARLGMPVQTHTDVVRLVEELDTSTESPPGEMSVALNETAEAFGIRVTPFAIAEESRCPREAACIQEGTVRVRAILRSELGESVHIFSLNETITTETAAITLVEVLPYPEVASSIDAGAYRFTFTILKRRDM